MDNKINWLTSVRGFACLIVLFAHILSSCKWIGINVSGCGKIGVYLFFVLSAFLLVLPFFKGKEVNIKEIGKFYIKRFFRIYPCYIITIIIVYLIGNFSNFSGLIKHFLLLEGKNHFWTVPVEMKFYICLPLLLIIMNIIKNKKLFIVFLILLSFVVEIIYPYFNYVENSISLGWYFPIFIMGIVVAYLYSNSKQKTENVKFDILAIVILILFVLAIPGVRYLLFNIEPSTYLQNKYIFIGIGWSLFLIFLQNGKYIKNFFESNKFLMWIGKLSFPIYLIHYIVLNKISFYTDNLLIKLVLTMAITILISVVMNKIIEEPMIKIGRKVNKLIFK